MARGRLREMRQLVRVKQREAQERHEYNRLKVRAGRGVEP